ncbi:hypothetical protein K523DRAFT_3485 [Schizophyllum commune Tattone D]|nr:hypothetical protein K523DRAFT_3485 [Schizophyllum commune Tattone D]
MLFVPVCCRDVLREGRYEPCKGRRARAQALQHLRAGPLRQRAKGVKCRPSRDAPRAPTTYFLHTDVLLRPTHTLRHPHLTLALIRPALSSRAHPKAALRRPASVQRARQLPGLRQLPEHRGLGRPARRGGRHRRLAGQRQRVDKLEQAHPLVVVAAPVIRLRTGHRCPMIISFPCPIRGGPSNACVLPIGVYLCIYLEFRKVLTTGRRWAAHQKRQNSKTDSPKDYSVDISPMSTHSRLCMCLGLDVLDMPLISSCTSCTISDMPFTHSWFLPRRRYLPRPLYNRVPTFCTFVTRRRNQMFTTHGVAGREGRPGSLLHIISPT